MTENWSLYHPEIPEFLRRLAETPPMARLRQVGMNCGCEYTSFPHFAGWAPYSRFDHSVGVGLIVWHFTGDLRQSAAGLLHDAATPAFAHVVDFSTCIRSPPRHGRRNSSRPRRSFRRC